MRIGEKIYILRKARGFSQEQLGLSLSSKDNGVSRQTVSDWENGKSEPKLDNIRALSDLLNVSFDVLLDEELDLNNPEYLNSVLVGTYGKSEEVLSKNNIFLYKRSYGLFFILLFLLVLAVSLLLYLKGNKEYHYYLAEAEKRNGDASVMGQVFTNRAATYRLMMIGGGVLFIVSTPIIIYNFIKKILSNKSIGVLSEKELILYPNSRFSSNNTERFSLSDIKEIKRNHLGTLCISTSDGNSIKLYNIKHSKLVLNSYLEYKNN